MRMYTAALEPGVNSDSLSNNRGYYVMYVYCNIKTE